MLLKNKELTGRLFLDSFRCISFYDQLKSLFSMFNFYFDSSLCTYFHSRLFYNQKQMFSQPKSWFYLFFGLGTYMGFSFWYDFVFPLLSDALCGVFFSPQFHISYILFSSIINFLRKSPRESPRARVGAWTLRQHHVQEPATPQLRHVHLCWFGCRDGETPSAPAFCRQALSLHCVSTTLFLPMLLCSSDGLLTNSKLYAIIL